MAMNEEPTGALRARCEDEVYGLHRFFETWLRGEIDADGEGFARASDVLNEGFHRISPSGDVVARHDVLSALRASHGTKPADFVIRIEDCRFRTGGRRLGVVTYEEWHEEGGERQGRIATAVLQDRADAPNGVEWVHLQETWLR
jgi:hypothetical protein